MIKTGADVVKVCGTFFPHTMGLIPKNEGGVKSSLHPDTFKAVNFHEVYWGQTVVSKLQAFLFSIFYGKRMCLLLLCVFADRSKPLLSYLTFLSLLFCSDMSREEDMCSSSRYSRIPGILFSWALSLSLSLSLSLPRFLSLFLSLYLSLELSHALARRCFEEEEWDVVFGWSRLDSLARLIWEAPCCIWITLAFHETFNKTPTVKQACVSSLPSPPSVRWLQRLK